MEVDSTFQSPMHQALTESRLATAPAPRMRPRPILGRRACRARAFTLLEGLIAAIVVAMVASAAAVAVSVGMSTQLDNQNAVLAMHAAELQMSSCMESDYDGMDALAGTEATGQMLAPRRPGQVNRPFLPDSFADLSRVTTVTAETRTFAQYNNISVPGKRVTIEVFGPGNTLLARLVRFRAQELDL